MNRYSDADTSPHNGPMTLTRAEEIAAAFKRETGCPCLPISAGDGFDCIISMDYLELKLIASGRIDPRDEDDFDDEDESDDDDDEEWCEDYDA